MPRLDIKKAPPKRGQDLHGHRANRRIRYLCGCSTATSGRNTFKIATARQRAREEREKLEKAAMADRVESGWRRMELEDVASGENLTLDTRCRGRLATRSGPTGMNGSQAGLAGNRTVRTGSVQVGNKLSRGGLRSSGGTHIHLRNITSPDHPVLLLGPIGWARSALARKPNSAYDLAGKVYDL